MGHHECRHLLCQSVVDDDVAFARLIHHRYYVHLAIGRSLVGCHPSNIGYVAFLAYVVAVDMASDVLYQTVVAHGYVAQNGIVYTGMAPESFFRLYPLVEYSEAHAAEERHTGYAFRCEVGRHADVSPVFCVASAFLERAYLVEGQTAISVGDGIGITANNFRKGSRCTDTSAHAVRVRACIARREVRQCSVSRVPR